MFTARRAVLEKWVFNNHMQSKYMQANGKENKLKIPHEEEIRDPEHKCKDQLCREEKILLPLKLGDKIRNTDKYAGRPPNLRELFHG